MNEIITEHGETREDLERIFDSVCSREHWKNPWAAVVPHELVGAVCRAVDFFHADRPEVVGIEPITGKVRMRGNGYQAW